MIKKAIVILFLVVHTFWLSGCTKTDSDETPGGPLITSKPTDKVETTNNDTIQKIIDQAESAVKDIKPSREVSEPDPDTHADIDQDDTDDNIIESVPGSTTEAEPEPKPEPEEESAEIPVIEPKTEIIETVKEEIKTEEPKEDKPVNESKEDEKPKKRPAFYQKCEKVFSTFVDKNGNVDYKNLKRKKIRLIEAERALEAYDPKNKELTENEEIALWINAHNIYTLKLIIDNYPINPNPIYLLTYEVGIIHIPKGRDKTYYKVMGRQYTLKEIEQNQLIEKFKDPRICFALSFASMGGAFLRNEPYYPEKLEKQLQEQTKRFINSPRGFMIDSNTDTVYLSNVFFQYKDTFIAKYGEIKRFREKDSAIRAYLNCIVDYLPEDQARYLELREYTVKFLKYDWNLNDHKGI